MKIDIKHVAHLANLPLNPEEEERFSKQLSAILDHIKHLQKADTKNIEPTSQVTGLENVAREDIAEPSLLVKNVLSQAKNQHNELFIVKGLLEE